MTPVDGAVIIVEARVAGQRNPLVSGWSVPLPASLTVEHADVSSPPRLRDLLAHVVRQEVRAFRQRQEERRLARVLSPRQIEQGVIGGKVDMGGRNEAPGGPAADVDEDAAIATALQAFEDGLYFVFLDGEQQRDLAAAVWPHPGSTLMFIRLVTLAGG